MKTITRIFIVFGFAFLIQCGFVNESYGSLGEKSINGVDMLHELMQKDGRRLKRFRSPNKIMLRKADLIVFLEKSRLSYGLQRDVETWLLTGKYPEKKKKNKKGTQKKPKKKSSKKNSKKKIAIKKTQTGSPSRKKPRKITILYLARDSSASEVFWRKLLKRMKGFPEKEAYCRKRLKNVVHGERWALVSRGLFGDKYRPYGKQGSAASKQVHWKRRLSGVGSFRQTKYFPVRLAGGRAKSVVKKARFQVRPLLRGPRGEHLIREIRTPRANLIIVYNSELFLNYHLARPHNRRLAENLIRYGLRRSFESSPGKKKSRPYIAVIERSLKLRSIKEYESEESFRTFRVFPINIIILHCIVLLLLYLWSRWPHEKSPLKTNPPGNREFIEHIAALGAKISRSGNPNKTLPLLYRFMRRKKGPEDSEPDSGGKTSLDEIAKLWDRKTFKTGRKA